MNKSTFVYVTFIRTTPERLWSALTTPEFMRQYLVRHALRERLEARLSLETFVFRWPGRRLGGNRRGRAAAAPCGEGRNECKDELKAEGDSLCTFEIEAVPDVSPPAVKLSIAHTMERPESKFIQAVSGGWPRILSNLKSLLESGEIALQSNKGAA